MTVQGGIRAPALEGRLAGRASRSGHYPQSFEYVSIGGCAATRSAGQASTGYGSIEKMVLGLRLAAPADEIALAPVPATAAGPGLRQLLVGSEGTLGVLTEVSLRVRSAPPTGVYEGMFFASFAEGVEALRRLAGEHDSLPDVVRLSDERETQLSLMLAEQGAVKGALTRAYHGRARCGGRLPGDPRLRGLRAEEVRLAALRGPRSCCAATAAGPSGSSPGHAWLQGRFEGPYLRDELLGHGVMVETLETATQWSKLLELNDAVSGAISRALSAAGDAGDRDVPRLARLRDGRLAVLHAARPPARGPGDRPVAGRQAGGRRCDPRRRRAPSPTTTRSGATTPAGCPTRSATAGVAALRAVKAELDPAGIMNPGKLL